MTLQPNIKQTNLNDILIDHNGIKVIPIPIAIRLKGITRSGIWKAIKANKLKLVKIDNTIIGLEWDSLREYEVNKKTQKNGKSDGKVREGVLQRVNEMKGEFTVKDVISGTKINQGVASSYLSGMIGRELEVVRQGRGKRKMTIYKRKENESKD